MNKIEHLKKAKQYLRKVVAYRRWLHRMNMGKPVSENMKKIDYNMGDITSFDRMMNWISQRGVQVNILELIPSDKTKWKTELQQLIHDGQKLQSPPAAYPKTVKSEFQNYSISI
jgi:uncharacterized protein YijF (DUF1287 family)